MIADARACIARSAAEIKTRILADAREFSDQQLRDDATLIVVAAQSIGKTASPTPKEQLATPFPTQA